MKKVIQTPPALLDIQKRELSSKAKLALLKGLEVTICATGNHIQAVKRSLPKITVNAYGKKVVTPKWRILRPEYEARLPKTEARSLEDLDEEFRKFCIATRNEYRKAQAQNLPVHVGNMAFEPQELADFFVAHKKNRLGWKKGYKFDLVIREVRKMGFSETKLRAMRKDLVERAFHQFTKNELEKLRHFRRWRIRSQESANLRAAYFNEQLIRWKNYFLEHGIPFCKLQLLEPYQGVYGETYWHNRRNKFIPEQAFDPKYYPKPEI